MGTIRPRASAHGRRGMPAALALPDRHAPPAAAGVTGCPKGQSTQARRIRGRGNRETSGPGMSPARTTQEPERRHVGDPDAARPYRPAVPADVARLLALQRSAGNAAVARMLRPQECILLPPDPSEQAEGEADEGEQERLPAAGGAPGMSGADAGTAGFGAILSPTSGAWAAVPSAASVAGF